MSFDTIAAVAADRDRRTSSASFGESSSRVTPQRNEWYVLLDRWKRLQPYADRFATAFFDTLFAREPDCFRQLFGSASLEAQFLRVAHVLTQIVSADDDREELDVRVELIVRRVARDDSPSGQSRAIRLAIAATLREVAAANMTPQMRASWKSAYEAMGSILRGTTWLDTRGVTAIRLPAARAESAADRHSVSVERLEEPTANAEAA